MAQTGEANNAGARASYLIQIFFRKLFAAAS